MTSKNFIVLTAFLAACSQQTSKANSNDFSNGVAFDKGQPRLELSVDFGETGEIPEGKIYGDAPPSVEKKFFPQVDANPASFVEAFYQCGELRVLIEQYPHGLSASVPVKENNPFRAKNMSDLELVQCFKKQASFSFNAAIKQNLDRNFKPFESLHAQKN